MLYKFFKFLLVLPLRIYFRNINFENVNRISAKNPTILSVNHSNSFMDAMLLAVFLKRKMYFLARADAFDSPFKKWFLSKINLLPVYRIRDGRDNLLKNDLIFEKCFEILKDNGMIMIFSEGNCVVEKRLRPLRAGTAQLAVDALARFKDLDLDVVPVSINYSNPLKYRESVSIVVGEPLKASFYKANFDDRHQAIKNLTADLSNKLKEHLIIIPDAYDDSFFETIFKIDYHESGMLHIKRQQSISAYLSDLKLNQTSEFARLKELASGYQKQLSAHKLEFISPQSSKSSLWFYPAIPFFVLSYFFNYPPKALLAGLVRKKVTDKQFLSAVNVAAGLFIFFPFVVLCSLLFGFIFKNYLLGAVFIAILSLLEVLLHHFLIIQNNRIRQNIISKKSPDIYTRLIKTQQGFLILNSAQSQKLNHPI